MNPHGPPPFDPNAPQQVHPHSFDPQRSQQRIPAPPQPVPARDRRPWLTSAIVRDVVQAVALLIAAMWGGYTFIYREIIIPARRPAALVVTPTLEAIGRRGDTILAKATFHMVNHSPSRVYSPAIWYSVRGLKLQAVAMDDSTYQRQNRDAAGKPYPTARFSAFTAADLIGMGKVQDQVETWFDPEAEQTIEHLLYIPADRYDAAQLAVQSLVVKNVGDVKEVRWRTTSEGDLEPRLVFRADSKFGTASMAPAALSDTSPRYVRWLRANQGGVNFVTATLSLWRGAPSGTAPPSTPATAAQ
ncbi:MAG TPA: hypothetical protein VFJ16_08365 [Longimicrobium sp.]|nr:hypothetical protein [Longimicrobium sp.]